VNRHGTLRNSLTTAFTHTDIEAEVALEDKIAKDKADADKAAEEKDKARKEKAKAPCDDEKTPEDIAKEKK
jgi:hypothetical protein